MNIQGSSWITEGYESWLASFDDACSFSHNIQFRNKTTVILLGLTQNGKTTLALRLLDAVEPEEFGKALRGGRTRGQSATPGPIAYIASTSDGETNYKAIENTIVETYKDYSVANEERIKLKTPGVFDSPPVIEVPSCYPESHFTIVDMAGFGGRESWAEVAADYWTARADYTILVIQAEKIAQFNEEGEFACVYRKLMNRLIHSHSLLVVTTYSLEQKRNISDDSLLLENVKENIANEFYKVIKSPSIDRSQIELYPVSFAPKESPIYELACILNNESIFNLKKILKNETILTRISNASVLRDDREDSLSGEKRNLKNEKRKIITKIKELKNRKSAIIGYEKELNDDIVPIFSIRKYPPESCDGDEDYHDFISKEWPEKAYNHYDKSLSEYFENLKRYFNDLLRKSNLLLKVDPFLNINTIVTELKLNEHLSYKIRKDLFYHQKGWWIIKRYDAEKSTDALYALMNDRNRQLYMETMEIVGFLRMEFLEKNKKAKNNLLKQKFAIEKELDSLKNMKNIFNDQIKKLDNRRENLPRIPDLVWILQKSFIREWNKVVTKANENHLIQNNNEIITYFFDLWAKKEWMEIITARFNKKDHIYLN